MTRRNPHVQGGLATPPPELDNDEPADDEPAGSPPDGDEDQGDDAGDDSADDRPSASTRPRSGGRAVSVADDGAGWILGLLLWGWVVLPFVKGGPTGVKNVLMAKFLNKAPDGSWLP